MKSKSAYSLFQFIKDYHSQYLNNDIGYLNWGWVFMINLFIKNCQKSYLTKRNQIKFLTYSLS